MSVEREAQNDTQNESTFSAASMFGMLLTLGTCLLLQPQGNLSLKKPPNIASRVLFFFFRLNPIVCAMDAVGVLDALMLIFWRAIGSCHGNPFRHFGVFAANLQAGAAGLLFLRSHSSHARLDERLIEPAPKRGHAMVLVDTIAIISIVCAAIKLGASVVPWHFHVITWTYIVGWFLVQLAVIMSHYGSSNEQLDPNEVLRSAEYLQQKARVLEFGQILGGLAFMLLVATPFIRSHHITGLSLSTMLLMTFNFAMLVLEALRIGDPLSENIRGEFVTPLTLSTPLGAIVMWVLGPMVYEEEGTFKPEWLDWLG